MVGAPTVHERLDDRPRIGEAIDAMVVGDAERVELGAVPAGAETEHEPAPAHLVVTRVAKDGFNVTDLSDQANGHNHIFAFNFSTPARMRVCDRVTYLAGTVNEFFGFTELNFPSYDVSPIYGTVGFQAPEVPSEGTSIRSSLQRWFTDHEIQPEVAAEFDDTALLKVFAQAGAGVFAISDVIADEVCEQHDVRVVLRVPEIREKFYAISIERRLKHPAVVAISELARTKMFG